jgi:4'-phosphopantetheinyl transferase
VGIRAILFTTVIEGVHIWRASLEEGGWPGLARFPTPERERFEGFLRRDAAQHWANSRWALRCVLARYLETDPAAIELELGMQGKPRLAGADGLEFNLSHSAGLALVAVAGRPIGIDVELLRPRRDMGRVAERVLSTSDVDAIKAAPASEQPAIFYAAWTQHEARLKCLGVGPEDRPTAAPIAVENIEIAPEYAAAVAVAGSDIGPVTCHSLSWPEASTYGR